MNYLIAHQTYHYSFLHTTARKKSIKHKLIAVLSGLALIRLGKEEYVVNAGQMMWLPFDCLNSQTYFPNCQTIEIEISVRSTLTYPFQAGLISPSPLLRALLDTLNQCSFESNNNEQQALLSVVNFELVKQTPQLTQQCLKLSNMNHLPNLDHASLQMALKVRQALKLRSSGVKAEQIIDEIFSGNAQQAEQLCLAIANQTL